MELGNPRRTDLEPVRIEALADKDSVHLCITPAIRDALELETIEGKSVVLADGTRPTVDYVGPIELRYGGRIGFAGALVVGDQPLLGVVPMEDMDLVVVPKTQQVIPNPENPGPGGSFALSPLPVHGA
ncbi:MAG: clan AA aspartic protease [Gammaproteobacteria bacterium]|nr:clan AA aspartic protease [Gammaproteobacteria bacterium]